MNEKDAKQLSIQLMEISEAAYLSTIDSDGFPQIRAMFNLRKTDQFPELSDMFKEHHDDFLVYFTTNTSSSKIKHIQRNQAASVYYSKPNEWRGLMLCGLIEIVEDIRIKKSLWQQGWEMYYPGGYEDPDYSILRLYPTFGKCYHQLNIYNFNFKERK